MSWWKGGSDPTTSYGGVFNPLRRQERREARSIGRPALREWRQNRWLERQGLGDQENPYEDILAREFGLYEEDLDRQANEIASMLGVEAAMTGGRESSEFQSQLSDLMAQKMQAILQGEETLASQGSSWEESELARIQAAIQERNARRAGLAGSGLQALGMGLSLIPGLGGILGGGLSMLGGGLLNRYGQTAGERGQSFADDYKRYAQQEEDWRRRLDSLRRY